MYVILKKNGHARLISLCGLLFFSCLRSFWRMGPHACAKNCIHAFFIELYEVEIFIKKPASLISCGYLKKMLFLSRKTFSDRRRAGYLRKYFNALSGGVRYNSCYSNTFFLQQLKMMTTRKICYRVVVIMGQYYVDFIYWTLLLDQYLRSDDRIHILYTNKLTPTKL